MSEFIVNKNFQFGGMIRRESTILIVSDADLAKEIAKGRHPDSNKPLSGLLNHCSPADDATAKLCRGICVSKEVPAAPTDEEKAEELESIRAEFDKMGKAWHPGWTLGRIKKELIKAKKEAGDVPEPAAPKKEAVRPAKPAGE